MIKENIERENNKNKGKRSSVVCFVFFLLTTTHINSSSTCFFLVSPRAPWTINQSSRLFCFM